MSGMSKLRSKTIKPSMIVLLLFLLPIATTNVYATSWTSLPATRNNARLSSWSSRPSRPSAYRARYRSSIALIPRGGGGSGTNTVVAAVADTTTHATGGSNVISNSLPGKEITNNNNTPNNNNNPGVIAKASNNNNSLPPLIDIPSVTMALRLTCETNRRLWLGSFPVVGSEDNSHHNDPKRGQSGQTGLMNVGHPPKQQHQQQQQQHPPYQQLYQQQYLMNPPMATSSSMGKMGIPPVIPSISPSDRSKERMEENMSVFHSLVPWEAKESSHGEESKDECEVKASSCSSSSTSHEATHDNDDESTKSTQNNTVQPRRGIARWGPEMDIYLQTLLTSIGLQKNDNTESTKEREQQQQQTQQILLQTILYLEKSTSLDTPRTIDPKTGQPYFPPVPVLLPQTSHRLVLTAFCLAVKSVRGMQEHENVSHVIRTAVNSLFRTQFSKLCIDDGTDDNTGNTSVEKMEISEFDMQQMEHWMIQSLGGDPDYHVHHYHNQHHQQPPSQQYYNSYQQHQQQQHWQNTPEEMTIFLQKWSETFYPQRLRLHEERSRSRWEMFWRGNQNHHYNHQPQQYYHHQQHQMHHGYHQQHPQPQNYQQYNQYQYQQQQYYPPQHPQQYEHGHGHGATQEQSPPLSQGLQGIQYSQQGMEQPEVIHADEDNDVTPWQ